MEDFDAIPFNLLNDTFVRCEHKQYARGATHAYLSEEESKEILTTINVQAAHLMAFYLRKVKHPSYNFFNDKEVARATGLTERQVANARRELIKAGWVKQVLYTSQTSRMKVTGYYFGKEAVSTASRYDKHMSLEQLSIDEGLSLSST